MRRRTLGCVAALALAAPAAGAQVAGGRAPQIELRADAISGRDDAVHLGAGVSVPASTYVRLSLVGAAGPTRRDGRTTTGGRVDASVRFVTDPFRQARWTAYGVAGAGALRDGRQRWRPVVVVALGLEGPALRGVLPALEVGLGGGLRAGVLLRRAIAGRR